MDWYFPWLEDKERIKHALNLKRRRNYYRLVVRDDTREFFLRAYPTKVEARSALLLFQEAVWEERKVHDYVPQVIDWEGNVIYDGSRFLPDYSYEVVAIPEIIYGIRAALLEKENKKYLMVTIIDDIFILPVDYEFPIEKKWIVVVAKKEDVGINFETVEMDNWKEAEIYAWDYAMESHSWEEIIVVSDIGGVYGSIVRVYEHAPVPWRGPKDPILVMGDKFDRIYLKLPNRKRISTFRGFYLRYMRGAW
ncbi:hypothetical protein AciM339_0690 [Aciduliprofundum sp. MAR08-339]|uniref:hypothetical protein n=1 Tax=Aciduliprofundum sp. (strain MAR08-339) TaxID=673860 RepID=UPI0002A49631|nr:hypothetical protein AciM339_0690 [Aciduliprofundum sp. MAR08-339]